MKKIILHHTVSVPSLAASPPLRYGSAPHPGQEPMAQRAPASKAWHIRPPWVGDTEGIVSGMHTERELEINET